MIFDSGYYSAMDRGYYSAFEPKKQAMMDYSLRAAQSGEITPFKEPVYDINQVGMSVTEGRQFGTFRQSVQSAIRMGAGMVELATQMEGSDRAVGAESYGTEAREELREMAQANEITFTSVHAPTNIGNLSGYAGPQQGFSDQQRKTQVEEIKKAIDFAADVAQGGAVVVHTGEWQRPISEAEWNKGQFLGYAEEAERAIIPIVDNRTGQILTQVRKNQIVARADWNRSDKGYDYVSDVDNPELGIKKGDKIHVDPGDYVDYEGHKLQFEQRVPVYNKETGMFDVKQMTWDDFVKEADERNKLEASRRGITVEQLKVQDPIAYKTPEEAFLIATTETQERVARGWALQYALRTDKYFEGIEKLKKLRKMYERIEAGLPEEEKDLLLRQASGLRGYIPGGELLPPEYKMTTQIIDDALQDLRDNIRANREMVTGQMQSAEEQKILREHAESIGKYAMKQSIKSMVESGIHAMDVTKEKQLPRPIFVAPENIFPEMGYGSHPEELKELVLAGRKAMAEELMNKRGMSPGEAYKRATDHIQATFDTQHLGMWKKHFVRNQGESIEQYNKRFDKWYLEQVEMLQESGVIGHVHLVDAMGAGHHHLPAGQGTLPVVDALKKLKQKGFAGTIISEGHEEQPADRILTKTWEALGSPIFTGPSMRPPSMMGGGPRGWTDVYQSYFGRPQTPYYVFGGYSPSEDWTLWSGVRME
ncbi:hypothetical protein JW968_05955 [Candidatus Woesearchaeota archaeon]|nr:hypothetical protein [Candidatus Woesearchaeota archaeon]